MKKILVAGALITGSLLAQSDTDQTSFDQAIANAKKRKQLTLLAGFRIKGDDTTPQDQFDAIIDKIANCLTEQNIQAAFSSCPFFAELNNIPGLSGSFFIQATDKEADDLADDLLDVDDQTDDTAAPADTQGDGSPTDQATTTNDSSDTTDAASSNDPSSDVTVDVVETTVEVEISSDCGCE